ncbi:MAG: fimbrillin family protein [Bacteroidales bacterium]|nr:fimbrillin family protein [Bacteroidales bacterium]
MKRLIIALGAALMTLAACNKAETVPAPQSLRLDLTVNYMGPGTKAVKTGWEAGDKVYVYFPGDETPVENQDPAYLTLTYDGGKWAESWTAGLEAEVAKTSSGNLYAAYVPAGIDEIDVYDPFLEVFRFYTQEFWCLTTPQKDQGAAQYTVTDGVLTATLDMQTDSFVQFFLPVDPEMAGNLTLSCSDILLFSILGFDSNYGIGFSSGDYGYPLPGVAFQGGVAFSGLIDEEKTKDFVLTLTDNNGTEEDESDDTVYTLTKNATLAPHDAVLLPKLSEWTRE